MSINTLKENLSRYNRFDIRYIFEKETGIEKEFSDLLVKINTMKFSDFEANITPGSTIIRDIFPEFNPNLSFEFDKFELQIRENSIELKLRNRSTRPFDLRVLPNFARRASLGSTGKVDFNLDELKQIDEFLKIHLIQKFFQIQKVIELEEIEIFSLIRLEKPFDLTPLNDILNSNLKKDLELDSLDFTFKEKKDRYGYFVENEGEPILLLFTHLKNNPDWTISIIDLLNQNLIKMQEHMGVLQNE
jgi:hypothetical protein